HTRFKCDWSSDVCSSDLGSVHLYYLNLKASGYDLKLLGQAELIANTLGSLRVRLIDRRTGYSVEGVPVTIALQNRGTGEVVQLRSEERRVGRADTAERVP